MTRRPNNAEEYQRMSMANVAITGEGLNTTMHLPCPFCTAPHWMCYGVLASHETMARGARCKECGRSAKALFKTDQPGNIEFEIVQTGGDDPPAWFPVPMRRVED